MSDFKKKLLSGTLYNYIGFITNAIIGFFTLRLIVNSISVKEYGNYTTFLTTFEYCIMFLGFGTYSALYRYSSELISLKSYRLLKKFIINTLMFQFAASLTGVIILYIFKEKYLDLFDLHNGANCMPFVFLLMTVQILNISAFELYESMLMQKIKNIVEIIYVTVKLGGLYLVYSHKADLYSTMMVYFWTTIFWTMLNYVFIIKRFRKLPSTDEKESPNFLSRVKRFAIFSYTDIIGDSIVGLGFDILIVSNILGASSTGLYSFAVGTVRMIFKMLPINICYQVIKSIMIQKYSIEKNQKTLSDFFNSYLKLNFFFTIPIIWGGFLFGKDIIILIFKPDYISSFPVMCVALISIGLFYSFWNPLCSLLAVLERPDISFYSKIFVFFNLAAGIIMTKQMGIIGPIIATGLTYFFTISMQLILLKKNIMIEIPWLSFIKINLNSGIMTVIMFCLTLCCPVSNNFLLIAYIAAGSLLYFAISFFNKVFNEQEKDFINSILKINLFKF
ncbi:polysaccharide biosynthesis C-terminal domain-containing protein [Candidatus Dependentiae bacterium]|nr:polysaccharide biosynthesis C-terminal domain-containing protein [Candidatus Dependentiae bacterium]